MYVRGKTTYWFDMNRIQVPMFNLTVMNDQKRGSEISCSEISCSEISGSEISCSEISCSEISGSEISGSEISPHPALRESTLKIFNKYYLRINPVKMTIYEKYLSVIIC